MGEANGFEHPDEIPADVGLIPAEAQARGTGVRVMVLVPVLAPRCQLERAEPPDIHAGIAFFDMVEMREAVHQALHMEGVDEADGAHPEETHPAEAKNQADANREDDDRRFGPAPDFVDATSELGGPALFIGGLSLIEPTKMGPEDQELLDEAIGLECFVREHAVIADGGDETAKGNAEQSHADNLEAWHRKEDQTYNAKNVNEDEISEDTFFAMHGFPEGPVPGALLLRYDRFHVLSGDLLS